jgi:hypothetical protein
VVVAVVAVEIVDCIVVVVVVEDCIAVVAVAVAVVDCIVVVVVVAPEAWVALAVTLVVVAIGKWKLLVVGAEHEDHRLLAWMTRTLERSQIINIKPYNYTHTRNIKGSSDEIL